MSESMETPSTPTCPALATETLVVQGSPSAIVVEKSHFADIRSLSAGQERQKYHSSTFTTFEKLTYSNNETNSI